ncbi:MAG: hypothetical protein GYA33_06870, partial [Thermogutta sp.]|nr:hypothetical protein [Thermogutta sp.]
LKRAGELAVVSISLKDLLRRIGYKRESQVVRYGSAANPDDFRAKPDDDRVRESPGSVSEIFEKRQPPRGGNR